MFWFFGHEACGILAPRPGIESIPPALEGKVLTTGPPGKSHQSHFIDEKLRNRENKDLAQDCTVREQDSLDLYPAPPAPELGKLSKIC